MIISISPDVERLAREKAATEGISVEAYVEQLIREDEPIEFKAQSITRQDPEFDEVRSAVIEGWEQAERGEGRPAEEVFAKFRAKYGLSR